LQPFADVQDDVSTAWDLQNTQTAVLAKAEELVALVNPLTGFETLGLTPSNDTGLTRRSFVEGTPPVFMTDVFTMEVGDAKVIDNGTGAIVVRLDAANAPNHEPASFI